MPRILLQPLIFTTLGILTIERLSRRTRPIEPGWLMNRRSLLKVGGLGLTALLTGKWRTVSPVAAAPDQVGLQAPGCILTPEQTEGPYYIPGEKVRRNITEHKPGTPLKLGLTVVDASTCKPIKGAAVDIWHCDAGGVYAGFEQASLGGPPGGNAGPTDKRTFLRGIQFTDSRGSCEFQTIYPGWYRGRTVHIHVKVHLGHHTEGFVVHTGQLYFSDSLTAKVYRAKPYRARAAERDTFNHTDGIYQNGGPQSTLSMRTDGRNGYVGSIILGVKRS